MQNFYFGKGKWIFIQDEEEDGEDFEPFEDGEDDDEEEDDEDPEFNEGATEGAADAGVDWTHNRHC